MNGSCCRWGILGTAQIAQKNWKAILNAPHAALRGVASREWARAAAWIDRLQSLAPFERPPTPRAGYERLLADPEIDAVYIPLPTGVRTEWAVAAAEQGKHILLEKPCATDATELARVIAACDASGVQLMDGVMFMHSQRLSAMREALDDAAAIGPVRRLASHFTFRGSDEFFRDNIRARGHLEPLGCLGDLGWYCIRIILWALDWQLPSEITARCLARAGQGGGPLVPTEFAADLFFHDNVTATFYCSFLTDCQQWIQIGGERGSLFVDDFVLPTVGDHTHFTLAQPRFHIDGVEFRMFAGQQRRAVAEDDSGTPNAQESRMFETFSRLVLSGQVDRRWTDYAWKTQQVLDACLRSASAGGRPASVSA